MTHNVTHRVLFFACVFFTLFVQCTRTTDSDNKKNSVTVEEKIDGVSFVSPPQPIASQWTSSLQRISAGWVAIIPFAFATPESGDIRYGEGHQWWGETPEGCEQLIEHAQEAGLKVMIKPQVWIRGSWPGDYLPKGEEFEIFKETYSKYIHEYAKLAEVQNCAVLCVGTEFKLLSVKCPAYWKQLIASVRQVYTGKVTYAANWDNYMAVTFWNDLDYIGVDAYFPLSEKKNPELKDLMTHWEEPIRQLAATSERHKLPVLFTEFGYKSTDQTTWNQWEKDYASGLLVNHKAQETAYHALLSSLWDKPWFAGGFLWKWYSNEQSISPETNSDYTPQKKPVEEIIRRFYELPLKNKTRSRETGVSP